MDCYVCTTKKAIITYKSIPYCDGCMPKAVKKQLNAAPAPKVEPPVLVPDPPNPYNSKLTDSSSACECTGTIDPGDSIKVCTSADLCKLHKCDNIDCHC
jgi:hypothetical protein